MRGSAATTVERLIDCAIAGEHVIYRNVAELEAHGASLRGVESSRIGHSRRGQPMFGWRFGTGHRRVSMVAGCHADEPLGPMTAQALPQLLEESFPEVLQAYRFHVVPQMNPDGADDNRAWFKNPPELGAYLAHVARELPGDDIEFGFGGDAPRPEAKAAMTFLHCGAPYHAHFSLHGMGFGEGAWFLIAREWIERTGTLRRALRDVCASLDMPLHDIDRHGEKGFERIDEGFCTTPLSTAMRRHFLDLDQPEVARKFQPTSMEYVQSLGGDPLCGVTEMPLFRLGVPRENLTDTPTQRLRSDLAQRAAGDPVADMEARYRVTPVPVALQLKLQLAFIVLALTTRRE